MKNSRWQLLLGAAQVALSLVAIQWLDYMQYLQKEYPYLFSLAVRTNPFFPPVPVVNEK